MVCVTCDPVFAKYPVISCPVLLQQSFAYDTKLITPSPLLKITLLCLTDSLTLLFGCLVVIQRGGNIGD